MLCEEVLYAVVWSADFTGVVVVLFAVTFTDFFGAALPVFFANVFVLFFAATFASAGTAFDAAQRAFCPAAILAFPSALIVRFAFAGVFVTFDATAVLFFVPAGRPRRFIVGSTSGEPDRSSLAR